MACVVYRGTGPNMLAGTVMVACILWLPLVVAKRAHDCGWTGWLALALLVPGVNLVVLLALALWPTKALTE